MIYQDLSNATKLVSQMSTECHFLDECSHFFSILPKIAVYKAYLWHFLNKDYNFSVWDLKSEKNSESTSYKRGKIKIKTFWQTTEEILRKPLIKQRKGKLIDQFLPKIFTSHSISSAKYVLKANLFLKWQTLSNFVQK